MPAGAHKSSGVIKATRRSAAEQSQLDQKLIAAAKNNDLRRSRSRTLIRRGADVNAAQETAGRAPT